MHSVVVHGFELLPNPPPAASPIEILAIHSDEDDDGSFVGGTTGCGATVPIPDATSVLIALALVGTGRRLTRRSAAER